LFSSQIWFFNEERACYVNVAIVSRLDWEMIDGFECGLLRSIMRKF
jgi:hypothetical protein